MHPTLGVLRLSRASTGDVANYDGWEYSDQLRAGLRMLFRLFATTKRKLNLDKNEDDRLLKPLALKLYKMDPSTLLLTTILIGSCIVVMSAVKLPASGSQRLASFLGENQRQSLPDKARNCWPKTFFKTTKAI